MVPAEERRLATILFADLVGSTELASAEDPERVRVLLERFYDAMAEEIETAGGTLEKFIGDAVIATFGAPPRRRRTTPSARCTRLFRCNGAWRSASATASRCGSA
jgi:class 3 adenylate cyclase